MLEVPRAANPGDKYSINVLRASNPRSVRGKPLRDSCQPPDRHSWGEGKRGELRNTLSLPAASCCIGVRPSGGERNSVRETAFNPVGPQHMGGDKRLGLRDTLRLPAMGPRPFAYPRRVRNGEGAPKLSVRGLRPSAPRPTVAGGTASYALYPPQGRTPMPMGGKWCKEKRHPQDY